MRIHASSQRRPCCFSPPSRWVSSSSSQYCWGACVRKAFACLWPEPYLAIVALSLSLSPARSVEDIGAQCMRSHCIHAFGNTSRSYGCALRAGSRPGVRFCLSVDCRGTCTGGYFGGCLPTKLPVALALGLCLSVRRSAFGTTRRVLVAIPSSPPHRSGPTLYIAPAPPWVGCSFAKAHAVCGYFFARSGRFPHTRPHVAWQVSRTGVLLVCRRRRSPPLCHATVSAGESLPLVRVTPSYQFCCSSVCLQPPPPYSTAPGCRHIPSGEDVFY